MSEWLVGRLLVATPLLVDPNFARSVVLLIDHDEEGALGVVLNRPTDLTVEDELPVWAPLVGEPPCVFAGGPVEPAVGVAIGEGAVPWKIPIAGLDRNVGLVDLDGPDDAAIERLRIFAGYAGWSPGQLEAEVEEVAWWVLPGSADDVFTSRPEDLWSTILRRQSGDLAMFAHYPEDVRDN